MPIVLIATPKANHDTCRKNWLSPQGHLTIVPVYNGCPCWLYLGFRVYSRCWLFYFHFVFYFLYSWACVCLSIFFKIVSPCLLTFVIQKISEDKHFVFIRFYLFFIFYFILIFSTLLAICHLFMIVFIHIWYIVNFRTFRKNINHDNVRYLTPIIPFHHYYLKEMVSF